MPRLALFASSSSLLAVELHQLAEAIGYRAARSGWELVFGGARAGLMDATARGFRAGGARITAIVPRVFERSELVWSDADELIVTLDLRERKQAMQARADAFLVLPGGVGTLDELLDTLALKQLRLLSAPIVLLNHRGHFDPTLEQLRRLVADGYAAADLRGMLEVTSGLEDTVAALRDRAPPRG